MITYIIVFNLGQGHSYRVPSKKPLLMFTVIVTEETSCLHGNISNTCGEVAFFIKHLKFTFYYC